MANKYCWHCDEKIYCNVHSPNSYVEEEKLPVIKPQIPDIQCPIWWPVLALGTIGLFLRSLGDTFYRNHYISGLINMVLAVIAMIWLMNPKYLRIVWKWTETEV